MRHCLVNIQNKRLKLHEVSKKKQKITQDADEPTWRGWRTTRDAGQALLTIGGAISSPRLSQHAPLEKPHEITRTCQTSDRLQREGPR